MKCNALASGIALIWLLGAACSSVSTSYDYDTSCDFSKLRSYGWMTEPAGTEPMNQLVTDRIQKAADAELAALGYQKAASDPDFVIAAHASKQGKVAIDNWGYGGWWGGGASTYHYTEGALVLDVINPKTKKLLWRGVGEEVVDPQATPDQRTETIDEGIKAILGAFPPGGKSPAAVAAAEQGKS